MRRAAFGVLLVVAGLTALCVASAALAQVPQDAHRYRRELTGHARLVWGLSAPVPVFAAQVHQESAWNSVAISRTGAAGLGQFMPGTAKWIAGVYGDLAANEPFNPSWSLRALVRYDRFLWERVREFETACDRMAFTLSDYNGGAGWRMKRQARASRPGAYAVAGRINPGIHPANQRENETYAPKILTRWQPLYTAWGPTIDCKGVL